MYDIHIHVYAKCDQPGIDCDIKTESHRKLLHELWEFCMNNKLDYDAFCNVIPNLLYKKASKIEFNCGKQLVHIAIRSRSKVRLAVTVIEKTEDGGIFPVIHLCKNPEEAVKAVKEDLETEANERYISFKVNLNDLKEDITMGNVSSGPYLIEPEDSFSIWLVTAELFDID